MVENKQRIMTINAKSLFKYFSKKKDEEDKSFCFDTRKRTLYTLVVKAENELEECPMLHQFLEVLKEDLGDKFDSTDEYMLHDKFLIMDFEDIFMPIDENASDAVRKWREGLQANVKDIIENGLKLQFDDHIVNMMPFDKSGNMSRNGRISFVNKEYVKRLNERLNLGIDFSEIQVILSKYYAYRGLYLSTSQRVNHKEFKITPETVVIIHDTRKESGPAFERDVMVETAVGKNVKAGEPAKEWEFKEPEYPKDNVLPVDTPYDGQGFITTKYAELINDALKIKGANSFQIRLPFAKGMLHQVDVLAFIKKYTKDGIGDEQYLYKDVFGIERDLRKAHILMTESMFKGKAWLEAYCEKHEIKDPMQYYCDTIAKFNHGFYVSGTNLPYGHSKYTHLSYQVINTLAFDDEQFKRIMEGHCKFIEEPIEFLKNWDEIEHEGVAEEDGEVSYNLPNWKRAVITNSSLAGDRYIEGQLENIQKSLLSKIALGKILVEGQTRYLCRDLAPLLSSLLRSNKDVRNAYIRSLFKRFYLPQGKNNELNLKYEDYYAFFRNPHLSRNEQYIMPAFVLPDSEDAYVQIGKQDYEHYKKYVEEMYDEFFGHLTGIVMVPRGSTLPLCLGGADFDGDLVSVVLNQDVVKAVARGVYEKNPPESLELYKRKLSAIAIPKTNATPVCVPEYVEYQHIYNTFSNYIGQISNRAISIGQSEYGRANTKELVFNANSPTCEKCTILTGLEIDAAKNGVHPNLDLILKPPIPKSEYLMFLRQFRLLKAEENFHLDKNNIKIKEENGVTEISAKNCKTKVKWNSVNEEIGTYINLLPKYFIKYFDIFSNMNKKKVKANLIKPELSKDEKNTIKEFKENCSAIFELYVFYKNVLLKNLEREKDKGYYAVENTEIMLMRMYDACNVDEKLFETLPEIKRKIEAVILDDSAIDEMRKRMNSLQWQFQPLCKRGTVLEQIIGNGFKEDVLTENEKSLLYHFNQQGYKLLWRLLDLIQGPKVRAYSEIYDSAIEAAELVFDEFSELESMLNDETRCYYENNVSNIEQKLYAHCLNAICQMISTSSRSIKEKEKLVYALYELTKAKTSTAKFFWDVSTWEDIKLIISEEEEKDNVK